jgi:hypothetical protein
LDTLTIRPLEQWEFNAFFYLPLDFWLLNFVFAERVKSKTPLQFCYSLAQVSEPATVHTVGKASKPHIQDLYASAFPVVNQIRGNAQLSFINSKHIDMDEDLLFKIFYKLNAWNHHE